MNGHRARLHRVRFTVDIAFEVDGATAWGPHNPDVPDDWTANDLAADLAESYRGLDGFLSDMADLHGPVRLEVAVMPPRGEASKASVEWEGS